MRNFHRISAVQLAILLFCFSTLQAQEGDIKFTRITVEDGLPGNTINAVLRDSRGFIWTASENGVGKYDAYEFVYFRHHENDSTSISSNIAYVLFEDTKERLWVGSEKGLDCYDRKNNQFNKHFFTGIPVRAIFEDRRGNLWIGSDAGLYRYAEEKLSFEKELQQLFDHRNGMYNTIPSIAEHPDGTLWIGTSGGLYAYDPVTKELEHFYYRKGDDTSLSNNNVRKVLVDTGGDVWVATYGGGLNRFLPASQTFNRTVTRTQGIDGISSDLLTTMWESPEGKIWVGTDGKGIAVLNKATNHFEYVTHSPYNASSLNNNVVRSISSDGRGGVWVGTYNGGVNLFDQNSDAFVQFQVPTLNGNGSITSFAEDAKGNIWIGTDGGGISFFDRHTGRFTNISGDGSPTSLSDNRVISLLRDRRGRIWIGTYLGGISVYDPVARHFSHYRADDGSGLTNNIVWALLEDHDGTIWAATNSGLNFLRPQEKHFGYFDIRNSSLSNNMVRSLFKDRKNRIWIGTQEGLNLIDESRKKLTVIGRDKGASPSLGSEWIRTIGEDKRGNIWVGTFSGGLIMLKDHLEETVEFTESDGLPDNIVSGILCDSAGDIWISTSRGLARLRTSDDSTSIEPFTTAARNDQFNINAAFTTSRGEFLFGSSDGFSLFEPSQITRTRINPYPPKIAITSFRIFNREITTTDKNSPLSADINETSHIRLNYDQSVITFEFSALNFFHSEKNRYAYKLQGFEKEWNEVGNKRSATYTNLEPGEYTFQVKAANNNGIWNNESRDIRITVTPPFWKTWAFKTAIGLIVMIIILSIVNSVRRRIREKIATNKLIADLEIKALIAQMNPHFIFNSLTSIQELIMTGKQKDAMHYLNRFSRLLRTVLECSEKNLISLEQEVILLKLYLELESMRFDNQFQYSISVEPGLDQEDLTIPTFLLQPFVENALWHGLMHKKQDRRLDITFSQRQTGVLECKISDNGIGRKKAEEIKRRNVRSYQSMGLKIMNERIQLMKKDNDIIDLSIIDETDSNGEACGTTVVIRLPSGPAEVIRSYDLEAEDAHRIL